MFRRALSESIKGNREGWVARKDRAGIRRRSSDAHQNNGSGGSSQLALLEEGKGRGAKQSSKRNIRSGEVLYSGGGEVAMTDKGGRCRRADESSWWRRMTGLDWSKSQAGRARQADAASNEARYGRVHSNRPDAWKEE